LRLRLGAHCARHSNRPSQRPGEATMSTFSIVPCDRLAAVQGRETAGPVRGKAVPVRQISVPRPGKVRLASGVDLRPLVEGERGAPREDGRLPQNARPVSAGGRGHRNRARYLEQYQSKPRTGAASWPADAPAGLERERIHRRFLCLFKCDARKHRFQGCDLVPGPIAEECLVPGLRRGNHPGRDLWQRPASQPDGMVYSPEGEGRYSGRLCCRLSGSSSGSPPV